MIKCHVILYKYVTIMWFLRMLEVPWMAKMTNTDVPEKAQEMFVEQN